MPLSVTVTATKLILSASGLQIRFNGQDIVEAKPVPKNIPNTIPQSQEWYVSLKLTGAAKEVYENGIYELRLLDIDPSSQPTWTNNQAGAEQAAADISVMIRSVPGGGGGGQVDTIVPGDAIDVDSTDPVNPIVNVKVDGVTIGINGSNELEVPAGGGGYVPTTRLINTTAPLAGGGDLSADRTLTHQNSGVVAAAYTNASITVNATGHVTAASSGAAPVTSVGATYPIQSSGGATPTISADNSGGGNGAADAGKLVSFRSNGGIYFSNNASGGPSISALSSGTGDGLYATSDTGDGVHSVSTAGKAVHAIAAGAEPAVHANGQGSQYALEVEQNGVGGTDLALFHDGTGNGMEVKSDGGLEWTSATGAQTTADNLPTFGAATKGVVPAAGAVPSAANFLDETGAWDQVEPGDMAGLGTGVATALGNNADSASGFVTQTGGDARYLLASDEIIGVLGSTQTTTSATLVDCTGLSVSVDASSTYQIEGFILFQSANVNNGVGVSLNGPASPTEIAFNIQLARTALINFNSNAKAYNEFAIMPDVGTANTTYFALMNGTLVNGANAGTLQVRFASENAGTTVRIVAGSSLRLRKIA